MKAFLFGVFCLVLTGGLTGQVQAMSDSNKAAQAMEKSEILGFSAEERRIIREVLGAVDRIYNGDDAEQGDKHKKKVGKGMPPGLAKRDELPSGLERHIEKHGVLPPGLEGRDLPDDLKSRLPKVRKGLKRLIVDDDVVLIEEATRVVIDVIEDVFKN